MRLGRRDVGLEFGAEGIRRSWSYVSGAQVVLVDLGLTCAPLPRRGVFSVGILVDFGLCLPVQDMEELGSSGRDCFLPFGVERDEFELEPLELVMEDDSGTVGVVPNILKRPPRFSGRGKGVGRGVMLVPIGRGRIVSVGLKISSRSDTVGRGPVP